MLTAMKITNEIKNHDYSVGLFIGFDEFPNSTLISRTLILEDNMKNNFPWIEMSYRDFKRFIDYCHENLATIKPGQIIALADEKSKESLFEIYIKKYANRKKG